jgi:hypothetical protein
MLNCIVSFCGESRPCLERLSVEPTWSGQEMLSVITVQAAMYVITIHEADIYY